MIVVGILIFALYQCTGGGFGTSTLFGPPDELPVSRYDEVEVGVYFSFPSESREGSDSSSRYIGNAKGTSACGAIARNYANQHYLGRSSGWSYVCCTHESGSDCYRKIR